MVGSGGRFRLNYLCLLGAILGIVAIFTQWFHNFGAFGSDLDRPSRLFIPWSSDWYHIFSILIIGGTGIAFFSPLGGFIQLSGIILFTTKLADLMLNWGKLEGGFWPAMGPSLALFASVVIIASFFRPEGAQSRRHLPLRERLLVFGMTDSVRGARSRTTKIFLRLDGYLENHRIGLLSGAIPACVYSFLLIGLVPISDRRWFIGHSGGLLPLGIAWALVAGLCVVSLLRSRRALSVLHSGDFKH